MNNRQRKYKIINYPFIHLLSYKVLPGTLLCKVLCYTTKDADKCIERP